MGYTDHKQMQLDRFLGQLPGHLAERLARAVEVDRLTGGSQLPHEELLEALRPQLREPPGSSRLPTPQRAFCRAFEDLLVTTMPAVKQKGRISLMSIAPVWQWLANDLMPERHKILCDELSQAIVSEQSALQHKKLRELWSAACAALKTALDSPEKKEAAARKLGSANVVEDAAEIALLISAGAELIVLLDALPRPLKALGQRETTILRNAYDRLSKTQPDLAPYIAVIAMSRLERPWEALHLAAIIAHASDDTVISNTDMGIVGELLFSDLDRYAETIVSVRPPNFDADTVLHALGAFAELSSGMVKELGIRRDGKWGQHLTRARAAVAQAMEGLLARAPKEISAALPSVRVGVYSKGPKPLDLSRAPDAEKLDRARRYARVLGQAKPFASAAAIHAKLADVMEEISATLRSTGEDLLRELRAEPPGAHAGDHLVALLDLSTQILGEEETDLLRRRSRVSSRR